MPRMMPDRVAHARARARDAGGHVGFQRLGVNLDPRAGRGQQFGLPRRCRRAAGDNNALACQIEEHRQFCQRPHARWSGLNRLSRHELHG